MTTAKKGRWVWEGDGPPAGDPPADDDDDDVEVAVFRGPGARKLLASLYPAGADQTDDGDDGAPDKDKAPRRKLRYFSQ